MFRIGALVIIIRAVIHRLKIISVEDIWSKFKRGERADRLVNGWYRRGIEKKEISIKDIIDKDQ